MVLNYKPQEQAAPAAAQPPPDLLDFDGLSMDGPPAAQAPAATQVGGNGRGLLIKSRATDLSNSMFGHCHAVSCCCYPGWWHKRKQLQWSCQHSSSWLFLPLLHHVLLICITYWI